MSESFQRFLADASFNTYETAEEGEDTGWSASAVTQENVDEGLDLNNDGTISQEEKDAVQVFHDKYDIDTYGEYEKLTTVLDTNNDGNLDANEYNADSLKVLDGVFNDAELQDLSTDQKLNLLQEAALSDGQNGLSTSENDVDGEKEKLNTFLTTNTKTTHGEALDEIRTAFGIVVQSSTPDNPKNNDRNGNGADDREGR